MRSLLLPLIAYTLFSVGCEYKEVFECGTDEQMLIDGVTLFGIDAESDSIASLIEKKVPEEDRKVSFGQALDTLLTEEVQCGTRYDDSDDENHLKYASYLPLDQIIVLNQKKMDILLDFYNFDDTQRVLDLYSKNDEGKYDLDKEKMKERLREEEDLTQGFIHLRDDIHDLYLLFTRVGDILLHESYHMTLDLGGFPHSHFNASADLLVCEGGWAVRDTMLDVSGPAMDLAYEAYVEVKGERRIHF
tara:strand:- start:4080 stop:4817 length:738 start_codon:yes stop_codon:yes gene_type:complete